MQHPNLTHAATYEVATNGWRIESQNDQQAILVKGKSTNHILHLALTILSCLLWAPVWPIMAYLNRRQVIVLSVDPTGIVLRQEA